MATSNTKTSEKTNQNIIPKKMKERIQPVTTP